MRLLSSILIFLAMVAAVLAVVRVTAGGHTITPAGAARIYNARYFERHYKLDHALHPVRFQTPRMPPVNDALPDTLQINMKPFPAIGDQEQVGACQAWASVYYQLSYEYRLQTGKWTRFSPCFAYEMATHGIDQGSNFYEDINFIQAVGIPRFGDYCPDPRKDEWPIPDSAYALAAKHKMDVSGKMLFGQNPGPIATTLIREQLAGGYPVNIALPVGWNFEGVNAAQGFYDGETRQPDGSYLYLGGHAMTIVGDYHALTHNGVTGWYLVANQWGKDFGVDRSGRPHPGHAGYVWISERTIEQTAWEGDVLILKTNPTPNPAPTPAPTSVVVTPGAKPSLGSWYVHGVYTRDTGVSLDWALNHYGDQYGISPMFLTAMAGAESGWHQYADRWGYGADVSFGLTQITVQTANYLLGTDWSAFQVRDWEDIPANAIWLAAKLLAQYKAYTGLGYPQLYMAYNAGPGYCCFAYPQGMVASNYYNNFLPNWYFALSHYGAAAPDPAPSPTPRPTNTPRPTPTPTPINYLALFPVGQWQAFTSTHHRPPVPYKWSDGTLREVAFHWAFNTYAFGKPGTIDAACGAPTSNPDWRPKDEVLHWQFARCDAWVYSHRAGAPIIWTWR